MMKLLPMAFAGLFALSGAALAHDGVMINDPYARVSGPSAKSGAVFFGIANHTTTRADRLVAVSTDAAERAELHTHREDANGVMRMIHVEEGFVIEAGATHMLERGGDHVMLMGLTAPLAEGDTLTLRLSFEHAGEVMVEVPVDNNRVPSSGGDAACPSESGHSGH